MPSGGSREGSGAKKKYPQGVKPKTFRLPVDICNHIASQDVSATHYLIMLVERDMKKGDKHA